MVSASIQEQKTNIAAQIVIGALKAIYKGELTALFVSFSLSIERGQCVPWTCLESRCKLSQTVL